MKHVYRTCSFCDSHCGIDVSIDEDKEEILGIRGDSDDPFSRGYICPKAYGAKGLHEDPDRLRQPLIRRNGKFVKASWPEALDFAAAGLTRVRDAASADQIGFYAGNPIIHDMGSLLSLPVLLAALGTRSFFTAASVDTLPKNLACALLFGDAESVPVPDVDRTDYMLIFGANPFVSNGSVMMAPDLPGRLMKLRERGGRIVVVDPRRNETAKKADAHHFIRPGMDAFVLLAMIHTLFSENRVRLGPLAQKVGGLNALETLVAEFSADRIADRAGMDADVIRQLARDLSDAPSAICYGRIGTCTQRFGTISSWAIDVLNILTGNLDRPGGVMFSNPAVSLGQLSSSDGTLPYGRFKTQVRGLPEFDGQLPLAALAEEIDEAPLPIRALVTLAGNPVLSAPNSARLARGLDQIEFMVSFDYYLNETTRYADVILPPTSPLERSNCDLFLYPVAIRNFVHYSPPALSPDSDHLDPWTTAFELASRLLKLNRQDLEEEVIADIAKGLELTEVSVEGRSGTDRVLDLLLRAGPYDLTLESLDPHGVDLGALEPSLHRTLKTPSGKIELLPNLIEGDLERLRTSMQETVPDFLLIGRRQIRSNNSWMHNIESLAKGTDRCRLLMNPLDAKSLGLASNDLAELRSKSGSLRVPVLVDDEIMPGVVSLPHGFGHDDPKTRLEIAKTRQPGVNGNLVTDDALIDEISGTAAFNGVPVEVSAIT